MIREASGVNLGLYLFTSQKRLHKTPNLCALLLGSTSEGMTLPFHHSGCLMSREGP